MVNDEWTQGLIEEQRQRVADSIAASLEEGRPDAALAYALERVTELQSSIGPRGQVSRMLYIVHTLQHHAQSGGLTSGQITSLLELGKRIVTTAADGQALLAPLLGEAHDWLGAARARDGDHLAALLELEYVGHLGRHHARPVPVVSPLRRAERAYRLGHGELALALLTAAPSAPASTAEGTGAVELRLRLLRLLGRLDDAERLAAALGTDSPALAATLEWERVSRLAHATGDLRPMLEATRAGGTCRTAPWMFEAAFWTRAVASPAWLGRSPKYETIRKAVDERLGRPNPNAPLYDASRLFESLHLGATPAGARIRKLFALLRRARRLPRFEHELFVWIAAARWLGAVREVDLARLALAEYRALSLRFTGGAGADVLGVGVEPS